jgi:hypothetical protein
MTLERLRSLEDRSAQVEIQRQIRTARKPGCRQRSAVGDAPEFSQSSKRSIELISVAKPDAIDAMRRGTMDTIGVLPERP